MSTKRFKIGILGAKLQLFRSCAAELNEVADLVHISSTTDRNGIASLDLLLLVVQPPHVEAIRHFGSLRERHPELKVMVLTSGLDVKQAVELVKLGAEDLLEIPDVHESLRRQVSRALLGIAQLTTPSSILGPLAPAISTSRMEESRRTSFRAAIPPDLGVVVVFRVEGKEARLPVADLSVLTDLGPGGIGLLVPAAVGRLLPLDAWAASEAQHPAELDVLGQSIRMTIKVVRFEPISLLGSAVGRLSVTYSLETSSDDVAIQRLWINAQRRAVAAQRAH